MTLLSRSPDERGTRLVGRASRWIWQLYDRPTGGFSLSPESPVGLLGTSCAVLGLETLGTLSSLDGSTRTRLIKFVKSHQKSAGWFEDPRLTISRGMTLDDAYLRGHATFLAAMALDALGETPTFGLEFLDRWRSDDAVYAWMERLDWTNPWRESNWVEWVGYWLLADAGLTAANVPVPPSRWPAGFGGLMAWLENHQDPPTGMWGNPPFGGPMRTLHLLAGAYHHYVFFYATGRPLRFTDRIIDHALSLQQPDGLFSPQRAGGGPCEDLDAVDILANMYRLTSYRQRDVQRALARALQGLLANQRADGAFVYSREPSWGLRSRARSALSELRVAPHLSASVRALRALGETAPGVRMSYAGSPGLPFRIAGGDMFSQWFRPLAIAIAATALGRHRTPVWWPFSFRRQITQGWVPNHRGSGEPGHLLCEGARG
jgi:hypothetical protein